jgi:hypothetical protein
MQIGEQQSILALGGEAGQRLRPIASTAPREEQHAIAMQPRIDRGQLEALQKGDSIEDVLQLWRRWEARGQAQPLEVRDA